MCVYRKQMHEPHVAGHYNVPLQATPPVERCSAVRTDRPGVVAGVLLRRVPQDVRISATN